MKRVGPIALCVYLAIAAATFAFAWYAMTHTPDVSSFRQFAEPHSHKVEGKISYLFFPFFLQLFGLALLVAVVKSRPADLNTKAIVCVIWGFVLMLFGATNAQHALTAARLLE